ncbi:hypothetical protein [Allobranchiibius sp. GilTou38]|uniref:hypothetical protein n=1 Tax=Allobranchiibius sp. GilTou38 TaxID=2815210 RepID=UPI001AA1826C|nr:hypothetical protein [Allobranchiibius sp. GilTou38]MBO1765508.1 hypothetical protein [Allobranchiibius sp. GilTou38]
MSNGYGPGDGYDDRDPDRTQRLPQGRPDYRGTPDPAYTQGPGEPARAPRGEYPPTSPGRSGISGGVLTSAIALALVVGGVVGFLLHSATSSGGGSNPATTTTVTSQGSASTVTGSGSTSTTTVTGSPSTTTETSTTTATSTATTTVTAPAPTP